MFPRKAPWAALAPLCLALALASAARAGGPCAESAADPVAGAAASRSDAGAAEPSPASAVVPADRAPGLGTLARHWHAGPAAAAVDARAAQSAVPADTCRPVAAPTAGAPVDAVPAARPRRPAAGDPFAAAALGVLPLASGFYLSDAPIKGLAFTLADLMLIGAIVQVRTDANHSPRDAATYYWLLAGVNLADALLSVLQVRSDAARRLSVNVNPSDRPGLLLGWRF